MVCVVHVKDLGVTVCSSWPLSRNIDEMVVRANRRLAPIKWTYKNAHGQRVKKYSSVLALVRLILEYASNHGHFIPSSIKPGSHLRRKRKHKDRQ